MELKAPRVIELVVEGLRGCPRRFEFPLRGRSICVLGENGHAKTTLADAAEFLSTGDLAAFHREGCSLEAAIHLDADTAIVEISSDGFGARRRTLSRGGGAGELERVGPNRAGEPDFGPIPIVRHATIGGFMGQTPGEKKKALLELLGLGALTGLREPLKTTCGHAQRNADVARREATAERAAVDSQLGAEELVAYAEQRRSRAGIEEYIRQPPDILVLELSATPGLAPDRAGLVDRLAGALASVGGDPAPRWNSELTDEATTRAEGTAALLKAAQRVLSPDDRQCPVCEQPIVGAELARRLAGRAASLEATRAQLAEAGEQLGEFDAQLRSIAEAADELIRSTPPGGWRDNGRLTAVADQLKEHRRQLRDSRETHGRCPQAPDLVVLWGLVTRSVGWSG